MVHKVIAVFKMNAKEILLNMSMMTSVLLPLLMTLMFRQIDTAGGRLFLSSSSMSLSESRSLPPSVRS